MRANWYAFEHDDRISLHQRGKKLHKYIDIIGDLGVVTNFPILPLAWWYYAKYTDNNKHRQFAMEYTATLYLALAESGILSYIPIHERPVTTDISFWEEAFRDDSSWPSGHVIPYMALFFKTLQFYGPYWSLIPLALTYFGSLQRIRDGKHWPSDVIGSFFITAFASEGVRAAAKYKNNHPFYKWIFEHETSSRTLALQRCLGTSN